ncbi:MAG TPA: winged helix-turn-helix domain-containing protein [Bradyrhizobium sp.]|jgi:predicted ATPase/DNA-binding winged helix-turn-helix (wHTH) protein|nr:winged helix-turn-helix domain-containing protein [Bradyrhizobium sp.]
MVPEQGQRPVYASAGWEIDLARRELRSSGVPVPLGGRAFEIVAELVQSGGELVSKTDLAERVWPRTFVEEGALRVHIAAIRKAFGPDRDMLSTAIGRGYRLLGTWQVRQDSTPAAQAAVEPMQARVDPVLTNLPVARFDLIGRASAIPYLRDLLSAYRVVTLTGPGGIGKTTLALEVARSVFPDLQGGSSLLVELASLSNPDLVPSALASVLGLKLDGEEISAASVARAIGTRELLLVLDNCEHVVDAVANLTEAIVSRCPRTTVLATSREVLRVHGEHVFRVPPLTVPPGTRVEPNDALGHAAVELFIARAAALGSDFKRNEENFSAIASICRRLDGIPLAIEFAAAHAVMMGPPEIAALLDDRFKFLTTGRRTALPRHQTLRATLDWSYDLLPETEARVLRHLAVFAGDFLLDAATAVAGTAAVTDHLANLVAKSLVVADVRGQTPHYRLLDTTRVYALEKLRNGGEYREAARRHAEFYRDFFAQAEAESESTPQAEWLAVYGRHIDNVRASLNWAFAPDGDPQIGVALTATAVPLWVQLSLLGECRERAALALASLGNGAGATARLRMQLSAALGWSLMYGVGRAREAGPAWATTLELADQLDDREYRLRALWGLCIDQFNNGEIRKALDFADRFVDGAANSTDPIDGVMADRLLATALHYLGDQNSARYHIERVLVHLADLTLKPRIVRFRFDLRVSTHYFQARILWLQGFADRALRAVERNIEEGRASGHALTFCSVLGQAACPITFLAGDLDAAERYCAALLDHTERHPIRLWNLWARCFKGIVMVKRGDIAAGLEVLRSELGRAGEARFLPRFLLPLGELAACLGEAGEVAQGLATVDEALMRCEARDERWYVAELLRIKGELLLHETQHRSISAAEQCFGEALELAQHQGALFWELRSALSLARLRIAQDRRADARAALAPVYEKFAEGFETADLRHAGAMLEQLSAS